MKLLSDYKNFLEDFKSLLFSPSLAVIAATFLLTGLGASLYPFNPAAFNRLISCLILVKPSSSVGLRSYVTRYSKSACLSTRYALYVLSSITMLKMASKTPSWGLLMPKDWLKFDLAGTPLDLLFDCTEVFFRLEPFSLPALVLLGDWKVGSLLGD